MPRKFVFIPPMASCSDSDYSDMEFRAPVTTQYGQMVFLKNQIKLSAQIDNDQYLFYVGEAFPMKLVLAEGCPLRNELDRIRQYAEAALSRGILPEEPKKFSPYEHGEYVKISPSVRNIDDDTKVGTTHIPRNERMLVTLCIYAVFIDHKYSYLQFNLVDYKVL